MTSANVIFPPPPHVKFKQVASTLFCFWAKLPLPLSVNVIHGWSPTSSHSLPSHEPALRSCCCLVFRSHLIPVAVSFSSPPKLPNKVTFKTFKTFSSAAGNARLSRKNLESLQSRAGRKLASVAIRPALPRFRPSVRVRSSPFKFPPLLFPPAWSVVDVEREKGEGGTTRNILLFPEDLKLQPRLMVR